MATCLARTMGSCWATSDTPVPRRIEEVTGRGGGQGHEGVEAAPVVLEPHPFDERGRGVGPHREVGVLGQEEGGEPAFFGLPGQFGRRQVPVGQEAGDAEAHGFSPQAGGQCGPGIDRRIGEQGGEGRLLARDGRRPRRSPARPA